MTAPNYVYLARRACGLSQEAFAGLLGLTQTEINRWENKRPATKMTNLLMRVILSNPVAVADLLREIQALPADAAYVPEAPSLAAVVVPPHDAVLLPPAPEPDDEDEAASPPAGGRTPVTQPPGSWDVRDEDEDDEEPTSFAGDGPPPHARPGGAGAFDPHMGYTGGQE